MVENKSVHSLLMFYFYLDNVLTADSLNSTILIPKTILEYPSDINLRIKYLTDEEDYTSNESIAFSIHTTQQISQTITILDGVAYENINYVFNIEVCSDLDRKEDCF